MNNFNEKITQLFVTLGFKPVEINSQKLYLYNSNYYKVTFINSLKSFVIEYAMNYNDAQNNIFEDGDLYSIKLGDELIPKLKEDLLKNYM